MKKHPGIVLFLISWCVTLLDVVCLLWMHEQLITLFLYVLAGGILTLLFFMKDKKTIATDIRKAISITFEIGALFWIIRSIKWFIAEVLPAIM